jgi:hypothetical protein
MDDHSSGTPVAGRLARPTRTKRENTPDRARSADLSSLYGLAPGGVYNASSVAGTAVRSYHTLSPLPADPKARRRFAFCCTFPGVAPAGRYPAPCFRGARTFLPYRPKALRVVIQPSGAFHIVPRPRLINQPLQSAQHRRRFEIRDAIDSHGSESALEGAQRHRRIRVVSELDQQLGNHRELCFHRFRP